MAKYKPGQTWPVGAFTSGLMLMFSDKELREGVPAHRNVKTKKPGRMGSGTKHDYYLKLEKYTRYPAGKPLKTDTAIRRFRQKHIFSKVTKWQIRKWRE